MSSTLHTPTLFVLGDSISMHYGPCLERSLRGAVEYRRKSGEEPLPGATEADRASGPNGGDSRAVRRFLSFLAESGGEPFDLLLANCGLHDIKTAPGGGSKQVPIGEYETNLREIIALARRVARRCAWVRTTPVVDSIHNRPNVRFHRHATDLESYDQVALSAMDDARVPIIDLFTFTSGLGPLAESFCDHVHYTERARELQGAFIAGWVTGYLAE